MWYDRHAGAIGSLELNPEILDIRTARLRFSR